jgi:hypothetical protein
LLRAFLRIIKSSNRCARHGVRVLAVGGNAARVADRYQTFRLASLGTIVLVQLPFSFGYERSVLPCVKGW